MNVKKITLLNLSILIILSLISLCIGRYNITVLNVIKILFGNINDAIEYNLIFNIRLPRVILVIISGGALALSGMVFQSIFQNPLISPDVLGVTSGCSFGAAIGIVFMAASNIIIQVLSFIFGLVSVIFSLFLCNSMKNNKILALIISGIVTSSIASSGVMIIKYFADPFKELPTIDFWLMGGFYNSKWSNLSVVMPLVFIATIIIFLFKWRLKVLTMGEDEAKLLGVDVKKLRAVCILAATLLVSSVISVTGIISWIGILAPHIVKSIVKEDITKIIPLTIITGAIIMVIADTLARSLISTEIPISILTSLIGAPFLVYIFNKKEVF
ncbi:iron ABC transporter permease [Clostridium botulinum]|uniref:Transport system permease protein n=1 Tax=Clostridium botulinum D str. 1873 TaxID=592027 RepID=A0A9P2G8B3_CLOBO|nr:MULTISPECIES: iron ABC transporter permease [Clostridium]NFV47867.1 iron ABC transporter permease [Clostridium botulinum]EES91713.1 transport system permease protein [Clostridium botulinum D str. 1873]MBO3441625.1 iron ABC transporter permease [Clostridium haemolyticum]MCD3245467.1 iron ABC transporter permease [Clostridium botulinum C]MCD3261846.1 iron ABC transporter permease [Clostridium botulinum C]